MSPTRIAAVIRRHWLVLWRGPHRWFEIVFWPVMDVILWGSLGLYVAKTAGSDSSAAVTAANFLLAGIVLFWTLTVVQMTMSIAVMDETNTRNLLNVLTTSVTPAEYLAGVAAFGLIKLSMTMVTLTLVTLGIYGFSLASVGWATVPIVLVLIVTGWAVGFVVLGLIIRFGPSAEILTWGINYVMMSLSGGKSPKFVSLHGRAVGGRSRVLPYDLARG
jgi:ABC-2 type transport system permease protein